LRSSGPALLAAAVLLAGCGGHRSASPEAVVRAWSKALNAGNNEAAAHLFARHAVVVQLFEVELVTESDLILWNAGLPCSGTILSVDVKGEQATATFELGTRPGKVCAARGQEATAVFTVRKGKIVRFEQIPNPAPGPAA
jgi:hypothetical protein